MSARACERDCVAKYRAHDLAEQTQLSITEHMLLSHHDDVIKILRDATACSYIIMYLAEIPSIVDVIKQLSTMSVSRIWLIEDHGSRITNHLEDKIVDALVQIDGLEELSWNLIGYNAENVIKIINKGLTRLSFNVRKHISIENIFAALCANTTITELSIGSLQRYPVDHIVKYLSSTVTLKHIDVTDLFTDDDNLIFDTILSNQNIKTAATCRYIEPEIILRALRYKHHQCIIVNINTFDDKLYNDIIVAFENNYNITSGLIKINDSDDNSEYTARNRLILPENVHNVLVNICIAILPHFDNIYCIMWIFDHISEHYYRYTDSKFKINVIMKVKQSIDNQYLLRSS